MAHAPEEQLSASPEIIPSGGTEIPVSTDATEETAEVELPSEEAVPDTELKAESAALDTEDLEASPTTPIVPIEELHAAIRKIVTQPGELTRRILRKKLEDEFKLPEDTLLAQKAEINSYVAEVLTEMAESAPKRRRTRGDDDEDEGAKPSSKGGAVKKQSSIMTRSYFLEHATPYDANVGPLSFTMAPRQFNTGSCGWFYGAKKDFTVGDKTVTCQLTFNCAVLGSKLWKEGDVKPE